MISTIIIASVLGFQGSFFTPQPRNANDPPRVVISELNDGLTVTTADGELLRGGVVSVFEYQRDIGLGGFVTDPAYYDAMQAAGMNAFRLICFDPWQASHGFAGQNQPFPAADFFDDQDMQTLLNEFDFAIEMASQRGMYVMINYHDTGGFRDPDYRFPANANQQFSYRPTLSQIRRFWRIMASRYRNRTHVFFELTNEPVQWSSSEYTAQDLDDFKTIYDDVRARAPRTHVVLCSFANTNSPTPRGMRQVAGELRQRGIRFRNESIGFHPYNIAFPNTHSSFRLRNLREAYPVINTEQNFPAGVIAGNSDPDAIGFDGDFMGVQSMERYGISWFHWNVNDPGQLSENFVDVLIPDAIDKGYFWVNE